MNGNENGEVKVKSLQKAMEILECFTQNQPLGVSEISSRLGLYKSNVHNILSTFQALGYVQKDADTGRYRLASQVMALARAYRMEIDRTLVAAAMPAMREIANQTGEIVYLSVPKDYRLMYMDSVTPDHYQYTAKYVAGEQEPMYATSAGKAMLAEMSPEEREHSIPEVLTAVTDYTITDRAKLEEDIRQTKERGYGIDHMELLFGFKCVGIAVADRGGTVVGALSICAPSLRMTDEIIVRYGELLRSQRERIEHAL